MSPIFYMLKRPCVILLGIALLIIHAWGDCGIPPKPDFAERNTDQVSFPVGSTVTFTCRPGYVRAPGVRNTITCQDDNAWSIPDEFCKRRSCGYPGDIMNGDFEAEDFFFGSRVTYKCSAGYVLLNKRNFRDCQANGEWSNVLPECDAVVCSAPERPANGAYSPMKDEYSYSDSVMFSCNNGLQIVGESSAYCTSEGSWSSSSPKCTVVDCPNPNVPNSRRLSGFVGPYTLNHAIRFECDQGFGINGSSSITCSITSQWKPEVPECLTVCGPPSTPPYAVPNDWSHIPNFFSGISVSFSCKEGYERDPNKNNAITCLSRSWSNPDQFCLRTTISCADPGEIENAIKSASDFLFGSRVTYECKNGYKAEGEKNYRECQADGTWSAKVVCKAVCDPPPKLQSAELERSSQLTHYFENTKVEYKCKEGYERHPDKPVFITCLGKSWTGLEEPCYAHHKPNVALIVGVCIAVLALLLCIILVVYCKKKQKRQRVPVTETPDVQYKA